MGRAPEKVDTELEIRLLGPIEVLRGGRPVPIGGPKPRALLAALSLDLGRVVSVDRIVEDLWPGTAPGTAPHAVQVYVSQLRKALGPVIATRAPGYVLELEPERVDVHRFTRLAREGSAALQAGSPAAAEAALREAIALWRGAALADFAYEPFAQAEIARLEELRLVTVEDRTDADLALGRHVELVSELEALVQAEPLRERPRAQLMLALYRSGRQADALAAYREGREALVEELGVEPGPALKRLEGAILRQDESLAPAAPSPAPLETRRLATFVSVGLDAVGGDLDVEAEDRLLETAADAVSAAVDRHGGLVERLADGSLTAVFGVPVAHEDDLLRAARAAVEAREAVASIEGLEIRVGMAAGVVVARGATATGPSLKEAARLRQTAGAGEIVVAEAGAHLLPRATLEPKDGFSLLVEVAPPAPAFEQRQDAPFVGRRKELGALRKALRLALAEPRVGIVTVIGPAGIGKSRLARELAGRAKRVRRGFGRCLPYGEGITYWPLREIVRGVVGDTGSDTGRTPSTEEILPLLAGDQDAGQVADLLGRALHPGETPPPAPEIAWAFRRFCEVVSRERPFVLVLDDLHWAEPTFLELVEHLADRGEGSVLVVCVAREELLEDHPDFLEGRASAQRIVLDALSQPEMEALVDGLGGDALPDEQRARIVETAGGNPLYLEQLLALATEGGLSAERPLPETIQALLVARLDRLGPGERAVLERGAVVGKEFTADDVTALLDPDAAPTAPAHLGTLASRGFVRPGGEGAFGFRHVLVQEAVYRGAPKRLRAELHERFADRLERTAPELAELDELAGYHLERAYRLWTELGESDRRTERLAEDGGRRLGAAGIRAAKRGDIPACVNLLGRATSLLRDDGSLRRELLCELGIGLRSAGDSGKAEGVLSEAIRSAQEAGDRRMELRARIEYEWVRYWGSGTTADALLASAIDAVPVFESVSDDRSLGRAWLVAGFVEGGIRGHYKAWEEAEERALSHYRKADWPRSTCLGELAAALYFGPAPIPEAMGRCELLLRDEVADRAGQAHVQVFIAGLIAQHGDFDEARELLAVAETTYGDLGNTTAAATYSAPVLADVELLANDPIAAEAVLRALCEELTRTHDISHLASRSSDLAEAIYSQGRLEEAEEWIQVAEANAAIDDLSAQVLWLPIRAKILAHRGTFEEAETLAREAVRLAESSDGLNRNAKAQRDLGEVLRMAGRTDVAGSAFQRAIELYEQKGNIVGAARVRSLQDDLALV